jgi:chaperone required for assembly of F1-ATPase
MTENPADIAMRIAKAPAINPLKRFHAHAKPEAVQGGWVVRLDGRAVKTPAKRDQIVPNAAVARLLAAEWDAQGPHIIPASMPVTRLVNVVIDRAAIARDGMIEEIARYAATDLLCHRTPEPAGLLAAQAHAWDPPLAWARETLGIALDTTTHALALDQPAASLAAARAAAEALDPWRLTIAAFATSLTGSAVLGLMLTHGAIGADAAFEAIRIEEEWHARIWGRDGEDTLAAEARRVDLAAAAALREALETGDAAA